MRAQTDIHGVGIRVAAARAGLSQHLIRMWERRYSAVTPSRTNANRRLYTDADVHRLTLLHRAVLAGHRIGDIAALPTSELEKTAGRKNGGSYSAETDYSLSGVDYVRLALEAVLQFDAERLDSLLSRAEVNLGGANFLNNVVMPFMDGLGDQWMEGNIRIAHEHMASAIVRNHIGSLLSSHRHAEDSPVILVATPSGQLHEIGALAVAAVAALEGWRPIYLGPNLPPEEIAGAAGRTRALAVALSLVYPTNDPRLAADLQKLRQLLPPSFPLLIGGRAATAYLSVIEQIQAIIVKDLNDFRRRLARIGDGHVASWSG